MSVWASIVKAISPQYVRHHKPSASYDTYGTGSGTVCVQNIYVACGIACRAWHRPEQDLGAFQQEDVPDPQQVLNWQGVGVQGQEPLTAVHGGQNPFLLHVCSQPWQLHSMTCSFSEADIKTLLVLPSRQSRMAELQLTAKAVWAACRCGQHMHHCL